MFVDSFQIRQDPDGRTIELSPATGELLISPAPVELPLDTPLVREKSTRQCPTCHSPFTDLRDIPFASRYQPLAVVGYCPSHKQFFKQPDSVDIQILADAQRLVDTTIHLPLVDLRVPSGPKSDDLLTKGVDNFADLFTARQKLYLATCKELLDQVEERHRIWLGLLVSTSLEFNSILCGYKGGDKRRPGAIRHVFSHHAYSFPHTALENNPVFSGRTSGTLGLLFRARVEKAGQWAQAPVERSLNGAGWVKVTLRGEIDGGVPARDFRELASGERRFLIEQRDSSHLDLPHGSVDHVVTDPPYFDSVQYSDLAHFFRAWLQWFLPEAADWHYDVSDSAVAETGRDGLKYQEVLTAIWRECHRVLKKPTGRMVFTFHHWRADAWPRLTLSLKHAAFGLVTYHVVHSENPISVHIRQLNALTHDSVLVLQPLTAENRLQRFPELDRIDSTDSHNFCAGCAQLLGYCLESALSDEEIMCLWREILET